MILLIKNTRTIPFDYERMVSGKITRSGVLHQYFSVLYFFVLIAEWQCQLPFLLIAF